MLIFKNYNKNKKNNKIRMRFDKNKLIFIHIFN